ncbi:hypothetical protein QBC41DRAFT_306828 [Cercophora samala]|uniref:Uncharacterized protein n=1 Tax=Cercophora samala TaxID=330535 RepID=A0AA39Z3G6_9PEZI|nr:hypothetical protein QBC41DRAFT_306828 [Cercophora samala]
MATHEDESNDLTSPPSLMSLMMAYTPPPPPPSPPPAAAIPPPPPPVTTENRTASSSITLEPPPTVAASESRSSSSTNTRETTTQVRILKRESIQIEIEQPPTADIGIESTVESGCLVDGVREKEAVAIVTPARSHQEEKRDGGHDEEVGGVKKGRGRRRGCGGCWGFWWGLVGRR